MTFFDDIVSGLTNMSPPIDAFGVGGSVGSGTSDDLADLDFFLLVPNELFRDLLSGFQERILHPKTLIASRKRGFTAYFGYQFTFVYEGLSTVDYFINCPMTLEPTPMAHKTRVLHDRSGYFTAYHRSLPGRIDDLHLYIENAKAELLWEGLRIRKYVMRQDFIPLVHRLERLRLVALAFERFVNNAEFFMPHDADKWVSRDLGTAIVKRLEPTFPSLDPEEILPAFRSIWSYATELVAQADVNNQVESDYWRTLADLGSEVEMLLMTASATRGRT